MDHRQRIFHSALERIDLSRVPALAGWTRKFAEIEEHRANAGKINKGGCLVVQAGRKTNDRTERAVDLFSCLPDDRRKVCLIFARYCSPWMLAEYPGILGGAIRAGLALEPEGWGGWTKRLELQCGQYTRRFWDRASSRRVLSGMDLR